MGVSPPHACGSPECDSPQVILHHRYKCRGGWGGTGTVPSFIVPLICISYHSKRNYHERPTVIHHVCLSS